MKTVKIHRQNKNKLKKYGEGTFNEIVLQLIKDVEDNMPIVDIDCSSYTSINLEENTIDRLRAYAISDGESIENILIRMLIASHKL